MIHRMVWLNGMRLWLHSDEDDENDAMLSPLHHYSENGDLLVNPFTAVSYAIVEDGDIKRWGQTLGQVSDLVDAEKVEERSAPILHIPETVVECKGRPEPRR